MHQQLPKGLYFKYASDLWRVYLLSSSPLSLFTKLGSIVKKDIVTDRQQVVPALPGQKKYCLAKKFFTDKQHVAIRVHSYLQKRHLENVYLKRQKTNSRAPSLGIQLLHEGFNKS